MSDNNQTMEALSALIREHFPDVPIQIAELGEAAIRIQRESYPFTLTLTRGTDEPLESYLARCQDVANYASKNTPSTHEPAVFDFSDTSKYRQVGPTSWEAITPGYHPTEETGERMHPLISRLSQAARRGRNLTEETPIDSEKLRTHWTHEMLPAMLDLWQELVRTDEDAQFIQRQIDDWERIIPAMTEWPKESE